LGIEVGVVGEKSITTCGADKLKCRVLIIKGYVDLVEKIEAKSVIIWQAVGSVHTDVEIK